MTRARPRPLADLPLFAPYQRHSGTSLEAAVRISRRRGGSPRLRGLVLAALRGSRGLTDEELQQQLAMNPSTERPRRVELVKLGRVVDSGARRPTLSGRAAVVWVATA